MICPQSSERNTKISVLDENRAPESCCRYKMWVLSKHVYPRAFRCYSCSLTSCRKVNRLGCTNVAKPEIPGLVNSMMIWAVRLLQILSSWKVQTSTQPVQKPLTSLKANCFHKMLHVSEILKQKLVLTINLQPHMLSNCWSQWDLCNLCWFQCKFLFVYTSFLLRGRLCKPYP